MPNVNATQETKRQWRPAQSAANRTTLDEWIQAHQTSSQKVSDACALAATELGIDPAEAPTRKSIDDMRVARFYPGLIACLLLERATAGAVTLETWVRDRIRFGVRKRS